MKRAHVTGIHFVCRNQQREIIAAARINEMRHFQDLPYTEVFGSSLKFLANKEFLFYSRLVLHPHYRKQGIKELLDIARIRYQCATRILYTIGTASDRRAADLTRYGFKIVGSTHPERNQDFPFGTRKIVALALTDVNFDLIS